MVTEKNQLAEPPAGWLRSRPEPQKSLGGFPSLHLMDFSSLPPGLETVSKEKHDLVGSVAQRPKQSLFFLAVMEFISYAP